MTSPRNVFLSIFLLLPFTSEAAWITTVEDDVFSDGKTAMLLGEIDQGHSLVFDCIGQKVSMSLLERGAWKASMTGMAGKLIIKVDDFDKRTFDVAFYERNEKNIGVITGDKDIKKVLNDIRSSKSRLLIGLAIPAIDSRWNSSANVTSSTASVDKFIKACNITL